MPFGPYKSHNIYNNVCYTGLLRKTKPNYFQKKCLTAGIECVMIILPLQEGSFFVPENKLLNLKAEGGLALFQVA